MVTCQHRDDGRGVCIDCGKFLRSAFGSFWEARDNRPRLHPESWRELRMLVHLHGADAIIRAVEHIKRESRGAHKEK